MTPVFKGTDLLAYQRAQILAVGTAPAAPTQHNLMVAVNHPFPEVGQPILTTDHRVLGFITGQDPADLQTFIYPIDQMLASAKKILKTGRDIQTGWLGVLLWNVEPGTGTGIVIRSVEPHSPADKAGLTAWDLLQKYNGKEIQSVRQLIQLVEETSIGSKADIEITREGNQKTLTVTIEARKPEQNNLRLRRDLSQLGLPSAPMPAEPEDNPPPLKVGLEVAELTPKLASFLKIPGQSGLVVTDVVEQSPAGRAGVRIGDAIVTLNGQAFPDPLSLASHFQNNGIDSQLIMKILRKGQEQTIAIQVDETRNRESEIGNQASKSQPQDRSDSGKREQ
jgi:S1-C subfamily serine protease